MTDKANLLNPLEYLQQEYLNHVSENYTEEDLKKIQNAMFKFGKEIVRGCMDALEKDIPSMLNNTFILNNSSVVNNVINKLNNE